MPFNSIEEIKEMNRASGRNFFSPDTMRFFDSRVLSGVIGGCYFITSERPPEGVRAYTVRCARDGGEIDMVGEFCSYPSAAAARTAARHLAGEDLARYLGS